MTTQAVVLSGLLNHGKDAWTDNSANLSADLFTGENRTIFNTIERLHGKSRVVDAVTVVEKLGMEYQDSVMDAANEFCSVHILPDYINELQIAINDEKSRAIGMQLMKDADVEVAQSALAGLSANTAKAVTVDGRQAAAALFDDLMAKQGCDNIGLNTGIRELDKYIGGMVSGDFIVIAARPSMGKTALMLNIAQNVKCPVGIFSLEMSTPKLMARLVSATGTIDAGHLKHPKNLSDDEWGKIPKALEKIQDGLFINDTGGISIQAIEAEARRMVSKGAGLICVDYLQLVTCKAEKRLEEVSEVSRRIQAMAKNLGVPIIVMAQLNRQVENTINPVYTLSMLRESGQIEQDADVVIFVDRPEQRDSNDRPGEAHLIVAKNRDGECGTARVSWQGRYQRFGNLEYDNYARSGGQ
jgi:replicative DNA helicase